MINFHKKLFLYSFMILSGCDHTPPSDLKGTWISSYSIGHFNNDINADEFYSTSSWEIYKIGESELTMVQFKNRIGHMENFEKTYEYEYQPGILILKAESTIDTLLIDSANDDSLVIMTDPSGLRKKVFRKLRTQPSVFPLISERSYELVGETFRDTFLILSNDKLVRIREGEGRDGQEYYWYTTAVDSFWFFNIEDQFGEPIFVQSLSGDTIHLKSYSYTEQNIYMVPIPESPFMIYLEGSWQQTGQSDHSVFLPYITFTGNFNATDSMASLRISKDSLVINYAMETGSWFIKNRIINNAILFDTAESNYQSDVWRIRFVNHNEMEVSINVHMSGTDIRHEPISFKRTK